jgi:hypothetical protein
MTFTIDISLPTLNEYTEDTRRSRYKGAATKGHASQMCMILIRTQTLERLTGMHDVSIDWYRSDKKHDPDNIYFAVKFILDGAVSAGLLPGDGRRHIRNIHHNIHESDKNYCVVKFTKVCE